jgi:hypothetical protein
MGIGEVCIRVSQERQECLRTGMNSVAEINTIIGLSYYNNTLLEED